MNFIHNEHNINKILKNYDIGLCTSKAESGPLSILEYTSIGMPFLSSNTGEVVGFYHKNFQISFWMILMLSLGKMLLKKLLIPISKN